MSKLYARYEIDLDKQENGLWEDFGDGIRIKIRRWKSKKSIAARREVEAPFLDKIRNGTITEDELASIAIKHMAYGIVTDWEGISPPDGESIPYSGEAAEKIFIDLPEFRDEVASVAIDRDNYKAARHKESEKN